MAMPIAATDAFLSRFLPRIADCRRVVVVECGCCIRVPSDAMAIFAHRKYRECPLIFGIRFDLFHKPRGEEAFRVLHQELILFALYLDLYSAFLIVYEKRLQATNFSR